MEAISKRTPTQKLSKEDVEKIVKSLDMKKAPDCDTWYNKIIVCVWGGERK